MLHRMTDEQLDQALQANEQLRKLLDDSPTNPISQRGIFRDLERDDREALISFRLRLKHHAEEMQSVAAQRVKLAAEHRERIEAAARASA